MCKSIECPNCSHLTFHKGTCENEECGFDPMNTSSVNPPSSQSFTQRDLLDLFPGVKYSVSMKPFHQAYFMASSVKALDPVIDFLNYEGPVFYNVVGQEIGFHDSYGIVLVKDKADKFFKILTPMAA